MKNRLMLAPMTNLQSFEDGRLSDEEFRWLTMRARGGFGLTMTCASHVQAFGKDFPGQLGCFSNDHLAGLSRLASAIRVEDSLAVIQLHHAGMRSPQELIDGRPVCPCDNEEDGADFVLLRRAAILHHDFPQQVLANPDFESVKTPVSREYLHSKGLSEAFVNYMSGWAGFVEEQD